MRRFTYLIVAMFVSVLSYAQTVHVQGVSRKMNARSVLSSTPNVVECTVDFDSIQRWVGKGLNRSALVVKWDDGKGGNTNLVWGYRWSSAAQGTGEAMLRAIAAADPNFYMLLNGTTQYGAAIGGIGYDLNGNGVKSILKGDSVCVLTNGVYGTSLYDFDSFSSPDHYDHWRAGWYNGYWSYWTADAVGDDYGYSGVGASSRTLSNGSIDGWSYMSDMTNWYSNDMTGTLEYLPALASQYLKSSAKKAASKVAATKTQVNTLEGFWNAVDNANAGDTIYFYVGMRGQVLEVPEALADRSEFDKSLTIIGNGVTIKGGAGWYIQSADNFVINDIVFSDLQSRMSIDASNLTMHRCVITNTTLANDLFEFGNSNTKGSFTLNMSNCRFSNDTITKPTSAANSFIRLYAVADDMMATANLTSCTVTGCKQNGRKGLVGVIQKTKLNICNNVIAGNDINSAYPFAVYSGVVDYKSKGYNVIEDSVMYAADHLVSTDVNAKQLDDVLKYDDDEYKVFKSGAAYQHFPANTTVEGVTLPTEDIQGLTIDYTKATNSGASQLDYVEATDYTKGTFIVNEDWYGHQNSTVNFLTDKGEWVYRVVQKENPGVELGATNQYGAIYGDKFYLIAKQDKDPGATIQGGRITVCNAKTLKVLKQYPYIATDATGKSIADGRAFLGVDVNKGYIGSSNGIYIFDLDKLTVTGSVGGTGNGGGNSYQQLYSGQIGNMVRVNDKVFAVHQKNGLLVIDAKADTVMRTIDGPNGWGYGSVVLSKDGNLWLSIANKTGSGQAGDFMIKLNPNTLDTARVKMPDGIYGPSNSWYAWTPDGFCASTQNNVLYWNGGSNSWFSNKTIYKYDIDSNTFSKFVDFTSEDWMIYGCSFRIDPVTDDAYVSLYKGFGDPTYVLRKYSDGGSLLGEYPMINNYWFPSLPVFPDNDAPVANSMAATTHSGNDIFTISLDGLVTDADNMGAAIVKTLIHVDDTMILTAIMENGNLVVTPVKDGNTSVTVQANSNGKTIETEVSISISGVTGIDNPESIAIRSAYATAGQIYINGCDGYQFSLYDLSGHRVAQFDTDASNFSKVIQMNPNTYILRGVKGNDKVMFKILIH